MSFTSSGFGNGFGTAGGYAPQPQQSSSHILEQYIQILRQFLPQNRVPQQVAEVFFSYLNPNDQNNFGYINELLTTTNDELRRRGVNPQAGGIRVEDVASAMAPWVLGKCQHLFSQMQPQTVQGYQPPQYAGTNFINPGQPAAPPSSAGMFSMGSTRTPEPPRFEFRPPNAMPQARDASMVKMTMQEPVKPLEIMAREITDPKVIEAMQLDDRHFKLLSLKQAELTGDITAVAASLESFAPHNTDADSADDVRAHLPEYLLDKEYVHKIVYPQISLLEIGVDEYIHIREKLIEADAVKREWKNIIRVLENIPHGIFVSVQSYLVNRINERLLTDLRVHPYMNSTVAIETLDDIRTLFEGGFNTDIEKARDWKERLHVILDQVINDVFVTATYMSIENKDYSDLLRCHWTTYVDGISKFDLPFIDEKQRDELLASFCSEMTILRIQRSYLISNTLTDDDLRQSDLFPQSGISVSQQVFWQVADLLQYHRIRHQEAVALFVSFASDESDNPTPSERIIVRTLDTGSTTSPQRCLHLVR